MGVRKALGAVQTILRMAIGTGFLFALGLNFANVVLRYMFHAPIYWAEEVMIFTFVWCVFLGAALVALTGEHLRVELLEWVLPQSARRALATMIHLTAAIVMTFVAWRASTLVEMVARLQQKSIIAEIPMSVPYGAVLVGSILIALASLLRAAEIISGSAPTPASERVG